MTFPVFGNASGLSSGTGTSRNPSLPTGVAAGQVVIGVCGSKNNATHSWSSPFTKISQTNSGSSWTVSVAWAPGSATLSAPSISWTGSAASFAQIFSYTSCDTVTEGVPSAGTTSPHSSASVTTVNPDSLGLYIDASAANTALTLPSGHTSRVSTGNSTSTVHVDIGDEQFATSGSATGAISTAGAAAAWVEVQLALSLTPTGVNLSVPGAAMTAAAGTLASAAADTLPSASMTAAAGALGIAGGGGYSKGYSAGYDGGFQAVSGDIGLIGVNLSMSAGTLGITTLESKLLTGAAATVAAGAIAKSENVPVPGIAIPASAGLLSIQERFVLPGAALSASAGSIAAKETVGVSGVAMPASAGSVATKEAIGLPGAALAASVGQLGLTVSETWTLTGVQANSAAGSFTFTTAIAPNLAGAQVSAFAGSLNEIVSSALSLAGALATAGAGSFDVISGFFVTLDGASAPVAAGTLGPVTISSIGLPGASAASAAGELGPLPQQLAPLQGAAVVLASGDLGVRMDVAPSPLGVEAQAAVGAFGIMGPLALTFEGAQIDAAAQGLAPSAILGLQGVMASVSAGFLARLARRIFAAVAGDQTAYVAAAADRSVSRETGTDAPRHGATAKDT